VRGILALLERSLRLDGRQLALHLQRLLVVALIYWCAVMMANERITFGAPGLRFFSGIAYINAVVMLIFGVQQFSSVITEEKEHGTLGLMMLTGLNPVSILLGKGGSRLIQSALLLAVQLPFALLAITLGGVTMHQIVCVVVALVAFLFCLANVGLLSSVVLRRTGDAAGMTGVWAMLYCFVPPFAGFFAFELRRGSFDIPAIVEPALRPLLIAVCDMVYGSSVFLRLSEVLSTGYTGPVWSLQLGTNVLFGLVCFGLAWWLFPLANRDPDAETSRRGLVTALSSKRKTSWRTAGRPWSLPLVWHTFHFTAGGWPIVVLKLLVYLAIGLLIAVASTDRFRRPLNTRDFFAIWAVLVTALLVGEAMLQSGRLFPDEFKHKTWSTLRLLPRSIGYLAYSKTAGMLLSMLPGAAFGGLLWLVVANQARDPFDLFAERGFWLFVLAILAVMHLLAWLSTFQSQTQMTVRAVLVGILGVGCGFLFGLLADWNERFALQLFWLFIWPLLIGWCVLAHILAGRQLTRDEE
jgi:hypothetical protein